MDLIQEPMPDFAAEEVAPLRDALMVAFGWNEERAIQHLEETWWQAHLQQDPPILPRQVHQEEDQERIQDRREEVPEVLAEQAQDKKKPSISDFEEDAPPPNVIASCLLQYTLQKIAAFEYIELWYFTRDGCFEATKQSHSQPDDTFGLLSSNDVLTLHPVVSVKASKLAKADHELMLTEILQVCTSYLEHIKEARWPNKHVTALFKFFWNIECHPFCLSTWHGDRILTTYAVKIRRHWHDKLKMGNAFNITIINENLLQHIVVEVNDAMLGKVSVILQCNHHTLTATPPFFRFSSPHHHLPYSTSPAHGDLTGASCHARPHRLRAS